jgi:hypothetical protein
MTKDISLEDSEKLPKFFSAQRESRPGWAELAASCGNLEDDDVACSPADAATASSRLHTSNGTLPSISEDPQLDDGRRFENEVATINSRLKEARDSARRTNLALELSKRTWDALDGCFQELDGIKSLIIGIGSDVARLEKCFNDRATEDSLLFAAALRAEQSARHEQHTDLQKKVHDAMTFADFSEEVQKLKKVLDNSHHDIEAIVRKSLDEVHSSCMNAVQDKVQELSLGSLYSRVSDLEQQFAKKQVQHTPVRGSSPVRSSSSLSLAPAVQQHVSAPLTAQVQEIALSPKGKGPPEASFVTYAASPWQYAKNQGGLRHSVPELPRLRSYHSRSSIPASPHLSYRPSRSHSPSARQD